MDVHKADIVISAVSPAQYPSTGLPEIALAGRSNVGKSSFINRMINRKGLARTSGKPGKTQTLNFYIIEEQFYFVDVPGYGYAKVSKTERAKWGQMLETYLTQRDTLKAVLSVVDLRHAPSSEDVQMYEFLKYYELPVIVVATKADKIPRGKWNKHIKIVKDTLNFDENDEFIMFSSETGEGKEEAWNVIEKYLDL
ncbi:MULTISPECIES: ribosome biogenesis GTP-binding protein YihA/YsxC [Carnobacterium]|nr:MULTISPECIES: ribosome biogenesis GTP-binding protein YihA/YsxC [Carnobacterium]ANZ99741.1 YihA family ribosome biogenesis GTP-binding protein [Carnobacterium divergens]MCO6017989.1 ribosome biogenesis GTP-binding protein YihA/YsxC [Carnobacterium divergens]MDO0875156.1 ribosome biogenesis GTP-binding protein YihA/YsxC [Carnobacterium divergens]MDT1938655.1 ribosome biogenesis GTP-binding protein YihA/YsxC [Carnobacterium divergens]MDT1941093.1 ribosome biogenesis GTP-binding protein YihA/Y